MSRIARVVVPEVPYHITCHERTGRPLVTDSFIARLENVFGRILQKQKPGPKGSQKKNRNHQIKYGVPGISQKDTLFK